jgi:hypothetical protein
LRWNGRTTPGSRADLDVLDPLAGDLLLEFLAQDLDLGQFQHAVASWRVRTDGRLEVEADAAGSRDGSRRRVRVASTR